MSADANGWQPISTAPKDGTRLKLRLSTGLGDLEYIGHKDQKPNSGWFIEPDGYWMSVTHWQPLPAPPVTA